jgi:prepilin-type N-terminal cleavage/methylation domain-containing protein
MTLRHSRGFTMVELISIMVIVGILAAVAIPRINTATSFRSGEFRDQVIAALRYAQKSAVSHRRLVCATLTQTSLALSMDSSSPRDGTCDADVSIPGVATQTLSAHQDGFTNVPDSVLYFQPDGRMTSDAAGSTVANFDNTVDGSHVVVWGATGYVGDGS